jgi:methylmalonyl-CoA/ethylmalonyl-CoA epimerase
MRRQEVGSLSSVFSVASILLFVIGGCANSTVRTEENSIRPPQSAAACLPSPARLNHVGIVFKSIDDTVARNTKLGLQKPVERKLNPKSGFEIALVPLYGLELEYVQPVYVNGQAVNKWIGDWAAKHGEGLHHLAFTVPDIRKSQTCLLANGFKIERPVINGATGWILFTDPSSSGNVYLELVQPYPVPGLWSTSTKLE